MLQAAGAFIGANCCRMKLSLVLDTSTSSQLHMVAICFPFSLSTRHPLDIHQPIQSYPNELRPLTQSRRSDRICTWDNIYCTLKTSFRRIGLIFVLFWRGKVG